MMIFKGRNRVTSGFRLAARPSHNGIDLVGDDDKTVHAVAGGTVGFAGIVPKSAGGLTWQWGYYVRIDGNDNRKYSYCHLAAGSLLVRVGQRVQAGTALGTMGNTGYSFGAHTHFEVRNAYGTPIDPASYAGVRNAVGTYTDTESEDDNMKFLKIIMDISVFGLGTVAAITVLCYLAGTGVKTTPLDNKYIPVICGGTGLVLGLVALYAGMPEFPATDPITAAAVGVVSGLAATGINQAVKQLGKTE